jgi:hypothetical protein
VFFYKPPLRLDRRRHVTAHTGDGHTIATEMVSYQTFHRLSLDVTFWLPQAEAALAQVEARCSPEGAVAKR